MRIGIGLPNAVLETEGGDIREWSVRADAAGFSTLAAIDRLVYPNFDPLSALAFAAAVTRRIELMTAIVIAPLRPAALLAKEATSTDVLSDRRLTLGLAPGGRRDDYEVAGVDVKRRGAIFDRQLAELERHFAGEKVGHAGGVAPHPRPGRPPILIGGNADIAFRRAARHDGWIMAGGPPAAYAEALAKLRAEWSAAGRDGQPRRISMAYYALGPGAHDATARYFGSRWEPEVARRRVEQTAMDARTIKDTIAAFEQEDCDEFLFLPTMPDPAQVDMLAEAAL